MANRIPPGARVIGQPMEVRVTDIRILEPASLTFHMGGCDRPNAVMRAEVVDVPKGVVMMVPFDFNYAVKLHEQLGNLIDRHNENVLGI